MKTQTLPRSILALLTTLCSMGLLVAAEAVAPATSSADTSKPAGPALPSEAPTEVNHYNASKNYAAPTVRIKDVADILGMRDNQLIGLGLVVGLAGTGDSSGTLTAVALDNLVKRLGITVPASTLKPKNIALVSLSAQLPPFIKKGQKLDVQVSSIGDASSLQGGILLQAPLQGADKLVYAVVQGAISVGGFSTGGGDSKAVKNHTQVGRVPNGALIEREVETHIEKNGVVRISLRRGDFTTAQRMAEAINKHWPESARAADPFTVEFLLAKAGDANTEPIAILSELEILSFQPDVSARVAVNERTGTIVAGANVKLSPTVLSHGNLFITITTTEGAVPGGPRAPPVKVKNTAATAEEDKAKVLVLEHGPTIGDLAAALNALRFTPRDIIAIFQALKEAGALNAELIIM